MGRVSNARPVSVKIEGLEEIQRALKGLEKKMQKKLLRAALGAGTREVRDEVRRHVPVDTGNLKRSIRARVKRLGRTGWAAKVVPTQKLLKKEGGGWQPLDKTDKNQHDGWYAHIVEYGTVSPRLPRGKKKMKFTYKGVTQFRHRVRGMPAKPFFRPGWDASKGRVVPKVKQSLSRGISREVKRQRVR